MQAVDYVSILLRWIHILAGILWIGLLYFFNFVNGPFTATMDADTKKKVVPELMPRALYWFRWGAAYTWMSGILLLGIVYIMGNQVLDSGISWNFWNGFMLFLILPMPYIYDFLAKSPLGKNPKVFAAVCFVLVCVLVYIVQLPCIGFGYRGFNIYVGAMFGTIMAFNVWFRIWRNQKLIITGVKTGVPADASVVALAGLRSKHNTYMSVPLVWTMINVHSVTLAGPNAWLYLAGIILLGWGFVMVNYKRAAKVKGF
jgi:uncharacterized membrane protein